MARIALDAMGGDHAPAAPIAAALLAIQELGPEHQIQLVGRASVIQEQLNAQLAAAPALLVEAATRFEIVDAPDVIEMTDKPSVAIRGKPQSSMAVGIRLQTEGRSDAFVSAGNTGAQMAASTFILRLHEGLSRPAIGTVFPTAKQPVVVLDAGANVDCSAAELVQFARLGSVYARDILGRPNPAVGLLSIGEEAEKGNAAVKEAHQLLLGAHLNFIGNVEGRDIPTGSCDRGPIDVVVCDGFTGNVLLKFYEAVAPMFFGMMLKAGVSREQLGSVVHSLDYEKYGGAPLLGLKGVSIICHGKSSPEAIKNGIFAGIRAVESHMSQHIREQLTS
ncbi:MAG: phosphate acyltransferase PlsX [Gemmatimonadetes bacterium]|nr:phosphate acyltransferase PlsX [Gemmatimonadota bacterium]